MVRNGHAVLYFGTTRHLVPHDVYKVLTLSWGLKLMPFTLHLLRWHVSHHISNYRLPCVVMNDDSSCNTLEKITSAWMSLSCLAGSCRKNKTYQIFKGGQLALNRVSKLKPKTCSVYTLIYSLQFTMGWEKEEGPVLAIWCLTVLLSQPFHWPYFWHKGWVPAQHPTYLGLLPSRDSLWPDLT